MALVAIVEHGFVVLGQKVLPGEADGNDDRAEFIADGVVGVCDGLLARACVAGPRSCRAPSWSQPAQSPRRTAARSRPFVWHSSRAECFALAISQSGQAAIRAAASGPQIPGFRLTTDDGPWYRWAICYPLSWCRYPNDLNPFDHSFAAPGFRLARSIFDYRGI